MIFETYIPTFPLNQFIECFVYYKGYNPEHSIDRFLPDGYTYIVLDLTDYAKPIYDNHTLKEKQSCRNVWFSGIREKYITIPSGKNMEMFVIYFHKGKAYPFAGMPMNELTDYVVDAELVLSAEILNMRELMLECLTVQQKFICADKYLANKFQKKLIVNPFIDYSVKLITQNPQEVSIHYLSQKVGYSQKHLIKIFKEHVGLTPKAFLKIIRFQQAIQQIEAAKTLDWTRVAFDCGYYDQAHFIHDFKGFSGFTPNQYLKMQADFTNYIALD